MFEIKCTFALVVLCIFDLGMGLLTLPDVEENSIIKTEYVIRSTINSLFTTLGIKRVKDKSRLKQYSVVHNYFISLTLQDYSSLKEIAKLTKVNKNSLSNVTIDYIALLNEILDEDNVVKIRSIMGEEFKTSFDMDVEIEKLEFLKKDHAELEKKNIKLNEEVLKILQQDDRLDLNVTTSDYKTVYKSNGKILDDLPTWHEDDSTTSGRRIYNGHRTNIKKFPFMASVQIFFKFQCGCSIIHRDLVLTAASCLQLAWNNRFYRENPAFLSVRVGSTSYETGGETIGVLEVYFHPSYNPMNLHNNLAVMRLVRRIKFKLQNAVKKINLDKEASGLPLNVQGIDIMGWGARTRSNKLFSPWEDILRFATISVYPTQDCQDVYSKEFVVTDKNFCAGAMSVGSGACNRDVGGPGIVSGKLVGVISFGAPVCGSPDAPTVFTKVGVYYNWIEEIMEQKDVPNFYQKTTSQQPKFPYPPPNFNVSSSQSWKVRPVSKEEPVFINPVVIPIGKENYLRQKHTNQKLFKEFLKTMFDSAEIQEYLDSVRDTPTDSSKESSKMQPKTEPIMRESSGNFMHLQDLKNQDLLEPKIEEASKELPKISDVGSSFSRQEYYTTMLDKAVTDDIIKNYQDLVMDYDSNLDQVAEQEDNPDKELQTSIVQPNINTIYSTNANEIHEELTTDEPIIHYPDIRQYLLTSKTDIPDTVKADTKPLQNIDSINDGIDNAVLDLLHLSHSMEDQLSQENSKTVMQNVDVKEITNNPYQPVQPATLIPDHFYEKDDFLNVDIARLMNEDKIIELLNEKIASSIIEPPLKLSVHPVEDTSASPGTPATSAMAASPEITESGDP